MHKLYTFYVLLILNFNSFSNESHVLPKQTPWTVLNTIGHSVDPTTGKVDDTEARGAWDSIIKLFKPTCPTNFDNGGGSSDDNTKYVKENYNIENIVYDPFMRPEEHNKKVSEKIKDKKFDCTTSFSVLNVIDNQEARSAHITLCHSVLKDEGSAFFKVWPGNGTGIEIKEAGRYQSNKNAKFYVEEIKKVFGNENVSYEDERTIKAIKKIVKTENEKKLNNEKG